MAIKAGQEQCESDYNESDYSESEQSGSQQSGQHHSIVLIRHGTTLWNVEKKYLGHTDIGLLPHAQDELASLREHCRDLAWDAVYCSDLLRCHQTLACIAPRVVQQAEFDPRLRENDFGQWEGLTYEQLKHSPMYRSWIDHPQEVTPPGGESWQAFAGRIDSFLYEHIWSDCTSLPSHEVGKSAPRVAQKAAQKNSQRSLIVTHGGVIRYMLSRLIDGVGFWDTHVIPGQAIQVHIKKQGDHWLGNRVNFPSIGL